MKMSTIGKSAAISGEISIEEDLTIEGNFSGNRIDVKNNNLIIGPQSTVNADLYGGTIVIMGTVKGNINASHLVELKSTGNVAGDIAAPQIALPKHAHFQGRLIYT